MIRARRHRPRHQVQRPDPMAPAWAPSGSFVHNALRSHRGPDRGRPADGPDDGTETRMDFTALRELFAGFLRVRAIRRHFRRHPVLEGLIGTRISREVPAALAGALLAAAKKDAPALLETLGSHLRRPLRGSGPDDPRPSRAERDRAREAAALVAAPLVLLPEPVQPPAHGPRLGLLPDRGHEGGRRDLDHGAAGDRDPLLAGEQSSKAADKLKAMVSNTATVIRRDLSAELAAHVASGTSKSASTPRGRGESSCPSSCWCRAISWSSPRGT